MVQKRTETCGQVNVVKTIEGVIWKEGRRVDEAQRKDVNLENDRLLRTSLVLHLEIWWRKANGEVSVRFQNVCKRGREVLKT